MTTMNDAEREAFEHCWAVRSADDEGNLGAKPLRSEADPQRYRGSSAQGSWVWFQRGAAWQRAQSAPAGERDSYWFSLLMNCAAELETASYCMTDTEAKRVAQSGAGYYRDQARAAWQRAQRAQRAGVPDALASPAGEREAFERETRYIVIKRSDLAKLDQVESDWPEFQPTWAAIEARVSGLATPVPAGCKAVPVELLEDLRDLAADAVESQRAAYAGYKKERIARMDKTVAEASALLASAGQEQKEADHE